MSFSIEDFKFDKPNDYRQINFEAAMKVIYDHNLYPEYIEALRNVKPDYKSKVTE